MTDTDATAGLRLDQAPPLSIPFSFFVTAPIFLMAAGALALLWGDVLVLSRYMVQAIAFTHALTLGVLTMVIFGALYQMTPVVAAAPVPVVGFARVVHASLVVGTASLLVTLLGPVPIMAYVSMGFLSIAWLGFLGPVGLALLRSKASDDETVRGMRAALLAVLIVWFLGVWIAHGHANGKFPGPRPWFMTVHIGVALLGFIGCLIVAVSYQVLPMFYLSPALTHTRKRWLVHACIVSSVCAPALLTACMLVGREGAQQLAGLLPITLLPAAFAVWVLHPYWTWRALAARKRLRADASLRFWWLGLASAPLCLVLGVASVVSDHPSFELAFAFCALCGWALSIVHGMLYRIGPFLIWFHRLSHLIGVVPVPSAAKLLPERWTRAAYRAHVLMLVLGALAITLRSGLLARALGGTMCVLAALIALALLHLVRYRAPSTPATPG
jgi:hypothetical protein